jgi:hypothetical protein
MTPNSCPNRSFLQLLNATACHNFQRLLRAGAGQQSGDLQSSRSTDADRVRNKEQTAAKRKKQTHTQRRRGPEETDAKIGG